MSFRKANTKLKEEVGELQTKLKEWETKSVELQTEWAVLKTECEGLKTKCEQLGMRCNELEEKNLELLPRVNDIVLGEAFKAMYEKGTNGRSRREDRLAALSAHRQRYMHFCLQSPVDVDRFVEEVRFPIVKFCARDIVS